MDDKKRGWWCAYCGVSLPGQSHYCPRCGTRLALHFRPVVPRTSTIRVVPTEATKERSRRAAVSRGLYSIPTLLILMALVGAVGLYMLGYFVDRSDPAAVGISFVEGSILGARNNTSATFVIRHEASHTTMSDLSLADCHNVHYRYHWDPAQRLMTFRFESACIIARVASDGLRRPYQTMTLTLWADPWLHWRVEEARLSSE